MYFTVALLDTKKTTVLYVRLLAREPKWSTGAAKQWPSSAYHGITEQQAG